MKLEVTAKYSLKTNLNRAFLCVILLIIIIPTDLKSQEFKLTFNQSTALSEALLNSSHIYHFKVAYDAQRLGSVYVIGEVSGKTRDEFIANLLLNSGFTYVYKHGSYLIVDRDPQQSAPVIRECQLLGTIVDSETGEQLPFASVIMPSQNIIVSASTNGTFSIKNIVANPMHVTVSYIGYYPLDTLLNWTDPDVNQTFRLKHKVNIIDSVDVLGSKVEMVDYRGDVDFATIVNPMRLIDMPLLVETDIFRTLQLLPGISYSESSSELSIRGGTSDQNLILFDGQTLYNLSHYYGVFSSVNPNIVKDIQVFKGGFDSRYGERISGVVDITGKSGNLMRPKVSADINLLSVNLAAEVPITKKLTIVAAGRRSYSDIYKTFLAKNLFDKTVPYVTKESSDTIISEPTFFFYDLNGKLNYRISNNENISISLYKGKDYYKNSYTYINNLYKTANQDSSLWYNYGASASWQKQWNSSFFSNVLIGTSGYINSSENETSIIKLQPDGHDQDFLPDSQNVFEAESRNKLKDFSISMKNTHVIDNFNQLNFGFLIRKNIIYYHKDADNVYVYDNIDQNAWITSVYFQDRISLFKGLILKPGVRLSYYGGNHTTYFEPRFALKYDFNEKFSCRLATGQYNQFISQVLAPQETGYNKSFWILANDSVNPVLQASHYIFGLAYETKSVLFDVEGYYKKYSGLQEYIYISQFRRNRDFGDYFPRRDINAPQVPPTYDPSYFVTGSGKSYGIDFFVRYKNRFYTGWVSYSLSKSAQKFDLINEGEEIPALTDQTHQLSISNIVCLGNWNFGLISLFSTGRPYIESTENQENMPIIRHYARMPNYFRTDISANYNFSVKLLRFKTGVSIINLFKTTSISIPARTTSRLQLSPRQT